MAKSQPSKNARQDDQPDPMVPVACRIPESLKARLQRFAESEDRVYQRLVGRAVREFLDREEKRMEA